MVKGNWERRIELTNQRRAEAKAKKNEKSTKNTPITNIITILQKYLPIDAILTVWVAVDKTQYCCSSWLRLGFCKCSVCVIFIHAFVLCLLLSGGLIDATMLVHICSYDMYISP